MGMELNKGFEGLERLEILSEQLGKIEALALHEAPENNQEAIAVPEIGETKDLATESLDRLEKAGAFEQLEGLHDSEMTESIAEYLSGLEELKYENWKNLTVEQRTELLNKMETRIAAIEHRPPTPIKVEKMKPTIFGYQDSVNNIIALNSKFVMADSKEAYQNVIDTIIHEGRHAYQHYNVDRKCIHDSLSVVNTWRENFYNPKYKYYSGDSLVVIGPGRVQDVGFRLYYYQPVEIDARNFASDVMLKLKQKGFFS